MTCGKTLSHAACTRVIRSPVVCVANVGFHIMLQFIWKCEAASHIDHNCQSLKSGVTFGLTGKESHSGCINSPTNFRFPIS
jgi:hypothetical protein